TADKAAYLGTLDQLSEIVHIYKIDEIIFCSQDVTAQQIMRWMTELGADLDYKIVPQESLSIIGSSSKNTSGQLYTIDIQFNIARAESRRNKRVFDVLMSLIFLLFSPLLLLFGKGKLVRHALPVLFGKKTWVGYEKSDAQSDTARVENIAPAVLPKLRTGVFHPSTALKTSNLDSETIQRLNFFYAKDYSVWRDWEVVWRSF
ncbi:MAG: nucleoside-diphosphate sugar epimerase/dehydratase, partial [Saprospiraceae bacterium]